ncbi:hypothetical protein LOK49_LG11G01402 [Camellia lanceoleosa]|uniref:Uncharacterized protein n=1 Tax=Camellia lanceoleosa TaxID=1840588 RepID=A0ACC0FY93_9ERIC|nr:hypothetical protein LOK49_LG11G01402 [Camellia lanceoleosa]
MNDIPITTTFSPSKQTHTQFSRSNPDLSTENPQSNIVRILPTHHFPPAKIDEALSMLKLNEDVVGDSKARVSEEMGEIRSAVEMAQLEAEKKHDEVVDEMLAMLNAKAEASRLKEVEHEVGKDVDEEQ